MMFNLSKDFGGGQGGQSRVAMYSTLVFYTVGVFTVAYVIGGQTLDYSSQAGHLRNFQMKAKFYKDQTRIHKQHYVALTATPVGAIPNCPVCGDCEVSPACDKSGCEICESAGKRHLLNFDSNDLDDSPFAPARHLLEEDTCPPCPMCNDAVANRKLLAVDASLAIPNAAAEMGIANSHQLSTCDKEALLNKLKIVEDLAQLPAGSTPAAKLGKHVVLAREKHAALTSCLRTLMPSVASAYLEALEAKNGR